MCPLPRSGCIEGGSKKFCSLFRSRTIFEKKQKNKKYKKTIKYKKA